ncbi:hypothetical protein [Pseudomonas abyssi]|uniref:hypothetical protein n=1 Tax=Pseudomonas abyssi TaxID=170540 RepID=UPI003C7B6FC8
MLGPAINIEISPTLRVNAIAARYQSLWLLVAICHACRTGKVSLPVHIVRARFPGKANWRMLISRAFSDFGRWGVDVGWGHDVSRDVRLLDLRQRSQGPFWVDAGTLSRVRILADGAEVDPSSVASFLGEVVTRPGARSSVARPNVAPSRDDVTYWGHMAQALRLTRDGFVEQSHNQLNEHYGLAKASAKTDFQRSLAVLKETLAWRKMGDEHKSHETLNDLEQLLAQPDEFNEMPTLHAMAHVAKGWDLYSRGDVRAANVELEKFAFNTSLQLVIRYNPKVRLEYLNLRALVSKERALSQQDLTLDERRNAAEESIGCLSDALQSAYEADSIEAAQDVAANIGFSSWLFWQDKLIDVERAQTEHLSQLQAVRWIGLSEWICDRFGVGGNSAWNLIFLLRVARGNCSHFQPKDVKTFQAQQPLTLESVFRAAQPFDVAFSKAKGFTDWSSAAAFAIEESDTAYAQYPLLQVANLLLEAAWYSTYEKGLCSEAYDAVERLEGIVDKLQAKHRRFFRESLDLLPAELRNLI